MRLKRNKGRVKIRNRLFFQVCFSFAIIITLFAVITGLLYMKLYEDNIIASYRKQLKGQAERIADNMSDLVVSNDTEGSITYMDYLNTLENSETTDIWFVATTEDGHPMAKEFTNADITDIDLSAGVKQVIKKAKKGKISYACGYDAIYERTMMCVAAPIFHANGKIVGIVLINSFVEQRDTTIATSREYIVYSILAGLVISLVISLFLARIITHPISKIRHTALELADGNYEKRTNIKRKNEIGILAHSMDVLAEELEKNEIERNQAEQLRLDFFANVSHELRTPITVMRGYSEALADNVVKEEKKTQYYNRMVLECQSMERLVGDLLTLSKMQNPHFEIVKEPVNLVQVFQDIMRSYKNILEKKQIQLLLEGSLEPVMMFGDYDRLRQLFINIIDNAIKFSKPQGRIWIRVDAEDDIKVSIKDEGCGITEEQLPNIFDKFYKSKLRQNEQGSGLGLVIVKYIVEKHNGKIEVESEVGKGTVFTFFFEKVKGNLDEIMKE